MGRREWTEMGKFLKDGKIVVILQGRYAGKKAVILKTMDDNTKERPYGHCVVVGVAKTPLPITRAMCKPTPKMKKLVKKRSTIKPFVKMVNFTHVMPTRYSVESSMSSQGCSHCRHLLRGCRQEEVPEAGPSRLRVQVPGERIQQVVVREAPLLNVVSF